MHWGEVWHGKTASARIARTALTPLSWLYTAGWQAYLGIYALKLKTSQEPHVPVLCVGNLQVGGTGKSPVSLHLASLLEQLGREVVVSSSGYGSPRSEGASVAPEGPLNPNEWGDEPAMFRLLAPELPLIVGRGRVEAGRLCHAHFPNAVMLMDDGFQHLPIKKHLTLLLDPPSANRRCLPAGPFREPYRNRTRASLVLPGEFAVIFRLKGFSNTAWQPEDTPSKANLVCALGNPTRFVQDVQNLGVHIQQRLLLPDHDPMDRGNLLDSLSPDLPLVVTAKDWVKLRSRSDLAKYQVLIACQEACIEPETEFRAWLAKRLDEFQTERSAR